MPVTFETPPGVRYACTQCGDCCRSWTIVVTAAERRRIEALDWAGKVERLAGAEVVRPVRDKRMQGRFALAHTADGACVFLGQENECLIHAHFGGEVKPLTCQLYPFSFTPMGARVAVDAAFSCHAVSSGHGGALEERIPDWAERFFAGGVADRRKHRLRAGCDVSADVLWEIEGTIAGYLLDENHAPYTRLRHALRYVRLATTGDPAARTASVFRSAIAEGVPAQVAKSPAEQSMDRTQVAAFLQWAFLLLNPPPVEMADAPQEEQDAHRARLVAASDAARRHQGPPWIDNAPTRAGMPAALATDTSAFAGQAGHETCRFLAAKVIGQKFLLGAKDDELPLVDALERLFLYYPLVIWTSKVLAADRGAGGAGPADARRAIRLLDKTVGLYPFEALPKQQADALGFLVAETDLVLAAVNDLVAGVVWPGDG